MITKERLKELIKKEATIWVKNQYCNAYGVELTHYDFIGITDNKESLLFLDYSIQEDAPEKVLVDYLENLYETKEDAKWASIATYRTEIFDPPVWEDFLESEEYIFWAKNHKQTIIGVLETKYLVVETNFERFYTGDLTKENYIEACEMARTIFLGGTYEKIN